MKRISKNKSGFTLVEVVLVVTIIVILAAVLFISVSDYLNNAHGASDQVDASESALRQDNKQIDDKLTSYGF